MDRNYSYLFGGAQKWVALRKESVDRNTDTISDYLRANSVALRKESVDRNPTIKAMRGDRKAVALRKESVDRNQSVLDSVRQCR